MITAFSETLWCSLGVTGYFWGSQWLLLIHPERPEVLAWPRNLSACRCWKRGKSTSWTGPRGGIPISVSCCRRILQPRGGWEWLQANRLLVDSLHGWHLAALWGKGRGLRSSGEREDSLQSLIVKRIPSRPWAHLCCRWAPFCDPGWGRAVSQVEHLLLFSQRWRDTGHRLRAVKWRKTACPGGSVIAQPWIPSSVSLLSTSQTSPWVASCNPEFTVHEEDQELCYPEEKSGFTSYTIKVNL